MIVSLEKTICSITILVSESISSSILLAMEITRLLETVGLSIEVVKRDCLARKAHFSFLDARRNVLCF